MSVWDDPRPASPSSVSVQIPLTRAELVAVKEAIEITPLFDGRAEARDTVRAALHDRRRAPLALDGGIARQLASRIVPVDMHTATARSKLQRAVRSLPRPETA